MDDKASALVSQIRDKLTLIADEQIADILEEARDEALTQVKGTIKEMMVQVILERALDYMQEARDTAVPLVETLLPHRAGEGEPSDELSPPLAQDQSDTESEGQVREGVEAIGGESAEDETPLSQVESLQNAPGQEPAVAVASSVPSEEGKEKYGYYVYGIVKGDGNRPLQGLPEAGIESDHPVYAVPYQAVQAIVSRVPLEQYDQEPLENNVNDMEWLEEKVRAHQRVLDEVSADHTLIPMKFCTIGRGEDGVQEILAQHYEGFLDALNRLDGKQEWGVKVYCDSDALCRRVLETNERLRDLKSRVAGKTSGAAYFEKKRLEKEIVEEAERVADECAQRSQDRLAAYAETSVINALQDKEITGRKEEMILNGAYLVAEDQFAAFQTELRGLTEEYSGLGFTHELTGPWPPYNFVEIDSQGDVGDGSTGG